MRQDGMEPETGTPAQFSALLMQDIERGSKTLRAAGVEPQ